MNLYMFFRAGILDLFLRMPRPQDKPMVTVSVWSFMPDAAQHVGRLQTMALLRRFCQKAATEFPGGLILNKKGFHADYTFLDFVQTQKDMGNSIDDMRKAWQAMLTMNEQ